MQFNRNNFLMTDHVFMRMFSTQNVRFLICLFKLPLSPYGITSNNCNNVVSPVYTVFVILCWYSKKWDRRIPWASILKFRTKHEDNPFTLNCFMVPRTCLFIFDAGSRRLGSNNFRNSSYKEKTASSARVSRLSFRFFWLWF